MTPRTDTKTLAQAMFILARDIHGGDGVANAAIAEAGHRMQELDAETAKLRGEANVLRDLLRLANDQLIITINGNDLDKASVDGLIELSGKIDMALLGAA